LLEVKIIDAPFLAVNETASLPMALSLCPAVSRSNEEAMQM
jgi:hypothetical protein